MNHIGGGRSQAQIRTVTICADVVSEAIAMIAKTQLIVGAIETPRIDSEVTFAIAFKSAAGYHIQYAIRTVAGVGGQSPSLYLKGIDIAWMELRANVARDVGIGYR